MTLLPLAPDSLTPAADSYVRQLREAQEILQRELRKSRKAVEVSTNRRRRPAPPLVIGQKVWLPQRHINTTRPSSKLDVRRLGPFPIIGQVGSSSYRLGLPSSIEYVFHVSLLEPHVANTFLGRVVDISPPIQVDDVREFEVQAILDSHFRRCKLQYFVDWVGYDAFDRSWERADTLNNATEVVDAFHKKIQINLVDTWSPFDGGSC